MKKILLIWGLSILVVCVNAQTKNSNPFFNNLLPVKYSAGFAMDGYWVWCSSVIKGEDGKYHMFASRWPKKFPFHPSWMVKSEIVRAEASNIEGPYEFKEVVLPSRGPQYWDGRSTHNPSITKFGDKYVLFYMGSTHPFAEPQDSAQLTLSSAYAVVGRSNKRIGMAIADDIRGPWKRFDKPIIDTKPNTFYSFLTSNPAPVIRKDGSVMVMFKGRSYGDKFPYQTAQKLGVAYAKSIYDPFTVLNDDKPLVMDTLHSEFEDPFLWSDDKGFHVLVKDMGSKSTGEHHAGVLFHSQDGVNWTVDAHPKAYSRKLLFEDGKERVMGQLERPFVYFEEDKPICMFFATMDGQGGFENGTSSWNIAVKMK